MQLKRVAPQLGRASPQLIKPVAVQITAPSRPASFSRASLFPRRPAPATCNAQRIMAHRLLCSAVKTKAADDDAKAPAQAEDQDDEATAEGGNKQGERSIAYQIFAGIYVMVLVFSWRIYELIVANAEDGFERLRRYVLEKFSGKR